MSAILQQLDSPIDVLVVSPNLPKGVTTASRKGLCIGWWMSEDHCQWLVAFNDTGELVWVPMAEIGLRPNWSIGRRFSEK